MNFAYEAYLDRWGSNKATNKATNNAYRNVLDSLCYAKTNFIIEKGVEKEKKDMYTNYTRMYVPSIKKVIFNNPVTIVIWNDGTKTTVKCSERDEYSEEVGLAMCISKKALGNKGNFNEVFKKHIPGYIKKD